MDIDRLKFYKSKGSSLSVLEHVVSELNIKSKRYVRFDDIRVFIDNLHDHYWMPSYVVRYISDNLTAHTGLNVKYVDCCFCGDHGQLYTDEKRGVSNMDFTCSKRCSYYHRLKKRCSKGFFKHIRKEHKQSQMTEMLFALSRRAKIIKAFR